MRVWITKNWNNVIYFHSLYLFLYSPLLLNQNISFFEFWLFSFLYCLQIVFIPVWIVMCIALIGVLYAVVLAIILVRSPDVLSEQRRGNISVAVGYMFFVVPLLIFEVRFRFGFLFL